MNTDTRIVRSAPAVMGYGAALSVVLAAFTYTGGKLTGYERDPTVDEVSRKEYLRKNRRRPVDEIVNELGEGRGMCWTRDAVRTRFEDHMLTCMQEFTRPATRSVGHSASRPTMALMSPPLLLRKYVSYTQTIPFPMFKESSSCSNEVNRLSCQEPGLLAAPKPLCIWLLRTQYRQGYFSCLAIPSCGCCTAVHSG